MEENEPDDYEAFKKFFVREVEGAEDRIKEYLDFLNFDNWRF